MEKFTREVVEDVVIENVNIDRATTSEAAEFKDLLLKEIKNGSKKIVVDFSKCEFMDSSFLGMLIIAYKESGKNKGLMKISGVHSDAQVILEITGTSKIFDQYSSKKEAVKSFNNHNM